MSLQYMMIFFAVVGTTTTTTTTTIPLLSSALALQSPAPSPKSKRATTTTFLAEQGVPTLVARSTSDWPALDREPEGCVAELSRRAVAIDAVGGVFVGGVLSRRECRAMIDAAETAGFRDFDVGKNSHGALQVALPPETDDPETENSELFPDDDSASSSQNTQRLGSWAGELRRRLAAHLPDASFKVSRRLRVYRYRGDARETFRPHVDAAFPALSHVEEDDDSAKTTKSSPTLVDDPEWRGRFTVLLYLNADFEGGETIFYEPLSNEAATRGDEARRLKPLTAVRPQTGAVLVFPQAEPDDMDASMTWPTHEGAPVTEGVKYVVRTDLAFRVDRDDADELAHALKWAAPSSWPDYAFAATARRDLYSPYMGVENAAPLLYAFVRFVKARRVLEIGAGYTSLWLLKALRDNDVEADAVRRAFHTTTPAGGVVPDNTREDPRRKTTTTGPRLLGWPWLVEDFGPFSDAAPRANLAESTSSSPRLLCVDDCLHGAQTARKVADAAQALGLAPYLAPLIDADAHDIQLEPDSLDFVWLDFGVADRLDAFLRSAVLPALKLGGFVCLHSSLTNAATRDWLERVRAAECGNPLRDDFGLHHISFLEPHKRFQNAITILQKRRRPVAAGDDEAASTFEEPIWSMRP